MIYDMYTFTMGIQALSLFFLMVIIYSPEVLAVEGMAQKFVFHAVHMQLLGRAKKWFGKLTKVLGAAFESKVQWKTTRPLEARREEVRRKTSRMRSLHNSLVTSAVWITNTTGYRSCELSCARCKMKSLKQGDFVMTCCLFRRRPL